MHQKELIITGKPFKEAKKALIMLHGRGASAEDILQLTTYLNVEDFAIIAPQATNSTWYPYSFLAPRNQNEPWLSSAIALIADIVKDIEQRGIPKEKIYFLGFSQGACLTLEYVTRHAARWGGAVARAGRRRGGRRAAAGPVVARPGDAARGERGRPGGGERHRGAGVQRDPDRRAGPAVRRRTRRDPRGNAGAGAGAASRVGQR